MNSIRKTIYNTKKVAHIAWATFFVRCGWSFIIIGVEVVLDDELVVFIKELATCHGSWLEVFLCILE